MATAGYGTALGVVRCLHSDQALQQVYACETRPYNQGARLTAFEIVEDQLPGTLICDSMASACMRKFGCDAVYRELNQHIEPDWFNFIMQSSSRLLFVSRSSSRASFPSGACLTFVPVITSPLTYARFLSTNKYSWF